VSFRAAFLFSMLASLLVIAAPLEGCAALKNAEPFLPSPDDIACVANEVEHGNTDAVAVIFKCGIPQDAISFIEHLILGQKKAKAMRLAAAGK